MPVAPSIRKSILQALDEHIIPALQERRIPQLLAEPPFDFSEAEHWVLQKELLPNKEPAPLQVEQRWPKAGVMSFSMPLIMFAYRGVCFERIGITQFMAQSMESKGKPAPGGVLILRLPAPALLSHSAHMLRSVGGHRPESQTESGEALICRVMPNGLRVSLNGYGPEVYATHNLEIIDSGLAQLGFLYLDELRQKDARQSAQALQLALMYRLKRFITQGKCTIANSSWVYPKGQSSAEGQALSAKNQQIYHDLLEYILANLHLPLTLNDLAERAGVSSVHLNTLFKQAHNVTLMRYMTQLRIDSAKRMILYTAERISDVALLVGFSSPASFSIVFRKHTGFSPHRFRKLYATKAEVWE